MSYTLSMLHLVLYIALIDDNGCSMLSCWIKGQSPGWKYQVQLGARYKLLCYLAAERKERNNRNKQRKRRNNKWKETTTTRKIQTLTRMAIMMLHILSQIKFDELCHPLRISVLCSQNFHYIWPFVDLESFHPNYLYRWRLLRYNMELKGE